MINFLKSLPDGISLSYMIFKLLDKNSAENHHYGYMMFKFFDRFFEKSKDTKRVIYLSSNFCISLLQEKYINNEDIIIVNFQNSSFDKDDNVTVLSKMFVFPFKECRTILDPVIEEYKTTVILLEDRSLIDDFYSNVESSFKENDITKLILELGRDPFNFGNMILPQYYSEELHNSILEETRSFFLDNPDLWK